MKQARADLDAFDELLGDGETKELEEQADILPFFNWYEVIAREARLEEAFVQ